MSAQPPEGPPDLVDWPETLSAHVSEPGDDGEMHLRGYAVQADLARHYSFAETVLLALTGQVPSDETGAAFAAAMTFAAGSSHLGQAPVHAAALARVCAAPDASVVSTGATGLAAQAESTLDSHGPLLEWLADRSRPCPATSPHARRDAGALKRLDAALPPGWPQPWREAALDLEQALLAVLHECGLSEPIQLIGALTLARLAVTVAEAAHVTPGALSSWPTNDTPRFDYHRADRAAAHTGEEDA